jgi:predicted phage terminase large subunit-like protein
LFNAQYQQAPAAPDGQLFKRTYFQYVAEPPRTRGYGGLFVSIDSALSTAVSADYSAITLVLAFEDKFYVLEAQRGRWDFDELRAKAWQYVTNYGSPERPVQFVIENAGSGVSLITHLTKAMNDGDGRLHCFSYRPKGDKVERAARVLPYFADGRVVLLKRPGRDAWVEPFVNEFLSFPNGRFDDQVDSLVQLLHARRVHAMAAAGEVW